MKKLLLILSCSSLAGMQGPEEIKYARREPADVEMVEAALPKKHFLEVQDSLRKKTIRLELPAVDNFYSTVISPAGNYVLAHCCEPFSKYDILNLYNVQTNQLIISKLTTSTYINQFSPDDTYLAITKDNTIQVLESKTGNIIYTISTCLPLIKKQDLLFLPLSTLVYVDLDDISNPCPQYFSKLVEKECQIKFIDLVKKEVIKRIAGKRIDYDDTTKQVTIGRQDIRTFNHYVYSVYSYPELEHRKTPPLKMIQ